MQGYAYAEPPRILYIAREFWKPGHRADLSRIEAEAARTCIALKPPHPWLGLESVTGSKEVWYLNGFTSKEDQDQVAEAYNKRPDLLAAMSQFKLERARFESEPAKEGAANYRADLSRGNPWNMSQDRFLVITVTKGNAQSEGSVFETTDGLRFIVAPAKTKQEAKAKLASAGPGAKIFAVRPDFSMPAPEWIAADPSFWAGHK
jgi:hypothetical protein